MGKKIVRNAAARTLPTTMKIYSKLPLTAKTITRFAFKLGFLRLLLLFLFSERAWSHTTIRSTSSSECASAQPSIQAAAAAAHQLFSPSACGCVRVCVYASECVDVSVWTIVDARYTPNVCTNLHLHTNVAARERTTKCDEEWKWPMRPASSTDSMFTPTMAPFTMSWAEKSAHSQRHQHTERGPTWSNEWKCNAHSTHNAVVA